MELNSQELSTIAEFAEAHAVADLNMAALNDCLRDLTDAARRKAIESTAAKVRDRYRLIAPLVLSMRNSGMTLGAIAQKLTELRAELNKEWHPAQVQRILRYAQREVTA